MRLKTAVLLILSTALAGCEGGSAPLPSASAAREALDTALGTWKAGKPASSLLALKPAVEAVDFDWKAGKVLSDYTVGDEAPGQGVRTLSATLTIQGGPSPKSVRYFLLGVDPVRVFRDEDFQRAMNMDNAPATKKGRR